MNDPDLLLVIGIALALLAIPSILSAMIDRRTPRASAVTVLIAGFCIIYAMRTKPGGYRFEDMGDVLVGVVARFI